MRRSTNIKFLQHLWLTREPFQSNSNYGINIRRKEE